MIVVDTSVVSYIFNRDSRADYYNRRIEWDSRVISFQTLEEMWFGAFRRGWGDRRKSELEIHLQQYEVIWPTIVLVRRCVDIRVEREKMGRPLSTGDAWIAATALEFDCELASHDRDFSGIQGLRVVRAPG